jgi:hypothetical protein
MHIRLLLASLILIGTVHAQGVPPDGLSDPLFPPSQTSLAAEDEIYLAYEDFCGRPILDTGTPSRQFMENGVRVVELVLLPPAEACFAPPPPPVKRLYSLGTLPKGNHLVERRLLVRAANGTTSLLHQSQHSITIGNTPHPAISGAWYDAGNPGTGLFLNLLPANAADITQEPVVILYWATLDENQQPVWFTGSGRFNDGLLDIQLIKGGANPVAQSMRLFYRGCGSAHWVDPRFPTFFTELTQLTDVSGVASCDPERAGAVVVEP